MKLTVVIPAYNERQTIAACLERVAAALPDVPKEIIIVDDCSRDGTRDWLERNVRDLKAEQCSLSVNADGDLEVQPGPIAQVQIRSLFHQQNKGKGGALQTGLRAVSGDIVVIQDADLEYDPEDWREMYALIAQRKVADVVYGSRFYGRPHRALYFHHYMANRLISFLFNAMYDQTLSDIRGAGHPAHHRERLRLRGPVQRPGRAGAALADLRTRDQLLRPHLSRRQEDQLERRREGAVVPVQVPLRLSRGRLPRTPI